MPSANAASSVMSCNRCTLTSVTSKVMRLCSRRMNKDGFHPPYSAHHGQPRQTGPCRRGNPPPCQRLGSNVSHGPIACRQLRRMASIRAPRRYRQCSRAIQLVDLVATSALGRGCVGPEDPVAASRCAVSASCGLRGWPAPLAPRIVSVVRSCSFSISAVQNEKAAYNTRLPAMRPSTQTHRTGALRQAPRCHTLK